MPRTKSAPVPVTPDAPDVRLVPIDSLHLDPQNVRTHPEKNLTAIRDSLAAFGQQKPLVVTADGMILAGNGAWQAAKQLGWTHIGVQVSTLEEAQARAYAVADNRTSELALWDEGGLAATLKDLYEQVLPLPGWEERDLERLWGPAPLVEVEPEVDRAEALREQYGVDVGQLWTCGRHRVLCGDCTEPGVVARLMQGEQAHAVVTDPPYGMQTDHAMHQKAGQQYGHAAAPKRYYADTQWDTSPPSLSQLHFILRCAPSVILWGGNYFSLPPARCWLVWDKQNEGNQFADCELAWTNLDKPVRLIRHLWNGMLRAEHEERGPHPTQKPLAVIQWALEQLPPTANVIMDLYLGSGTTLIACEQLQRTCYGIEIDPNYVAVTLHRWATLTGETPVLVEG